MAFQSVRPKPATEKKAPRRRARLNGRLCISTDSKKRRNDDGTVSRSYAMRITLPAPLMQLAKLEPGTRVDFEVDPQGRRCRIRPCEDGRWSITYNRDVEDKGYLRITLTDGMPSVARTEPCHGVRIRAQGLEFSVPDCASFDRNLRADADAQADLPGVEPLARHATTN